MQCTFRPTGATKTTAAPGPRADRGHEILSVPRVAPLPKILIVEDNPASAQAASNLLAATGRYEILVVRQAARAFFSARSFRPDLVLLDLAGAGKGSAEVKCELSEDVTLGNVPILALEEIALGKSVDPETLLARVEELLRGPGV